MRVAPREDGFALPFTIFLVTLITIMLAAAFARASTEYQIADSSEATVTALGIAQSGLQAFFGDPTIVARPASLDSTRYNVAGGYAWVVPEEYLNPDDTLANDFVYVIRSTGYLIDPNQGSDPQATRTVAQIAKWQTGGIDVQGVITTANAIFRRAGGSVSLDGSDQCGLLPLAPALRAPMGNPPPPLDYQMGAMVIADPRPVVAMQTGVEWTRILGGGFEADYTTVQNGDMTFPTQQVVGNALLNDVSGTGLLIVTGDLTTTGTSMSWNGVIVVGGQAVFDAASNTIFGAVISGLNELVAGPIPNTLVGLTTFNLRFDSCRIDSTLQSMTGFVAMDNAWIDNWATY